MLFELDITALTHGGRGLGRRAGKAVFVPGSAPGDRVLCRIVRDKPRYTEAALVEILSPSSMRRTPPCPYFGDCGGCQWQHLAYADQLAWKGRIFNDLLLRGDLLDRSTLRPIIAAPYEWRYRNRVQFKCRQTEQGFVIGFYRPESHYVVDVPACLLLRPEIQAQLDRLRGLLPDSPCPEMIPQVDVACGDDGRVVTLLHVLGGGRDRLRRWLVEKADRFASGLCLQSGRKQTIETLRGDGRTAFRVDDPPLALEVSAGGFTQVNAAQNRRLVEQVLSLAALSGGESALELFCGAGNFSLPLARRVATLRGVEAYAPAIDDAVRNAARNRIANVAFRVADATLQPFEADGERACDLVVVDPPRQGCYVVVRQLLKQRPAKILYVSCDPATLARDLKPLVHGGYRVTASQPLDMFPQTWHIESVTLLESSA